MSNGNAYELVTDEDGEVYYRFEAEDDQTYLADLAGNVVAREDADGDYEPVEEDMRIGDPAFPGHAAPEVADDRVSAFDGRLSALEAGLGLAENGHDADADAEQADAQHALTETLNAQLEHEARARGLDFTRAELQPILERVSEQMATGQDPDVHLAVGQLALENPGAFHDEETRQGRLDWQVQRLQDGERDQRGQGLGEPDAPRTGETPDLDDRDQRHQFMADRLEGLRGPLESEATEVAAE